MKEVTTVKGLCEFIWYLENKYNLLDLEIDGIKPWQSFRLEVYYELGKNIGLFEEQLQRGLTRWQKLKSLLRLLINSLLNNPLTNLYKVDYLIFSHPRSKVVDQEYVDIYTYYLKKDLEQECSTFFDVEEQFNGRHIRGSDKHKLNMDYISLVRNLKPFFTCVHLSGDQKEVISDVTEEINSVLKIDYRLEDVLIRRVKKFLASYHIYYKILEKTSPQKIFLVVSYSRPELIKAAKILKIETIELQHGTFSKYHLGYSFPGTKNLDYFPDKFYVWNDYWKSLIDFPVQSENVIINPFMYLETEKQKYTSIKKVENRAIVLCQGGLTDGMAKLILDNFSYFSNMELIFKLHPEEYGRSHLYKNLLILLEMGNVQLVEDVNLYELFSQCIYQIGVFSTAVYEGVEFKPRLPDPPGS